MKPQLPVWRAAVGCIVLGSLVSVSAVKAPPTTPEGVTTTPTARTDEGILPRQAEVIRRARESAPAKVVFVGDSITQSWEDPGAAIWQERFAPMGALNLGVSGDRTEHVLWRLQEAPLTRLNPRAVVLLIGTNNLGHGTANAQETLAGVKAVVAMIRKQVPDATLVLCSTFPRGETINAMRGDILQVNQAVAVAVKGDPKVVVVDLGDKFVSADGTISRQLMPDALHLTPKGYAIWADGITAALVRAGR